MTVPSIQERLDNGEDIRDVLNSATEIPEFHTWAPSELKREFSSTELRNLARFVRRTKAWNGRANSDCTAHFISTGYANDEAVSKYDAPAGELHDLTPKYRHRIEDSSVDTDSTDNDESSESNDADKAHTNGQASGTLEGAILDLVEDKIDATPDKGEIKDLVRETVDESLDEWFDLVDSTPDPVTVDLIEDDEPRDLGVQHGLFPALLRLTRMDSVIPYVVGPPGGGKSHAMEAVADAMGLDFYSSSCSQEMSKYSDFLGIFNPQEGEFTEMEFVKALKNGGLFLLDEVDRAPAGVLIFLNSLMANGHVSINGETIHAHEDFVLVCAGNTHMRGRSKKFRAGAQDVAFIDRLAFLDWPTDEALEASLCGINPSMIGADRPEMDLSDPQPLADSTKADWLDFVQSVRKAMQEREVAYLASMRASIKGIKMLSNGFPRHYVEEALIWRGCDPDTKERVQSNAERHMHRS